MEYIIGEAVSDAQLVVGEVYADLSENSLITTFLKFVKRSDQGNPIFEWVGGCPGYSPDHEGLYRFNKDISTHWYKTTIKQ